jgi:hypothetical protein
LAFAFNWIVPAVMANTSELSASNHRPKALSSLANGPRVFLHRVILVFPATRGYAVSICFHIEEFKIMFQMCQDGHHCYGSLPMFA